MYPSVYFPFRTIYIKPTHKSTRSHYISHRSPRTISLTNQPTNLSLKNGAARSLSHYISHNPTHQSTPEKRGCSFAVSDCGCLFEGLMTPQYISPKGMPLAGYEMSDFGDKLVVMLLWLASIN